MAEGTGVDVVFAPSVEEIYRGDGTTVSVKEIANLWEGEQRPGHFDGVATVVCKLFNIVTPNLAYFGLKDLQQCAVIKKMVSDLDLPIELKLCPTLREEDGLAMSSRNAYLSIDDRSRAPHIYQQLTKCATALKRVTDPERVQHILNSGRTALIQEGFVVDYFALVDTESMAAKELPDPGDSVIVAARLGSTRLIDNEQLVY